MRITRLVLGRYGHLSDVELTFPAERGLHVVLGPNEAGKSTALAAIGDCLFGFPHRTPYAFLHATRDLRIGIGLRAADGREALFFRRKGRKDDLCDAEDRPLPESDLARFLGGVRRERFARAFGLDAAELRRGGAAILKGEGEVGESILQAHTGLHGFRALVEKLGEDAARLFGDRRGRREFHIAVAAFTAAKEDLDKRIVQPIDYKKARDEQERLVGARAGHDTEAAALHAERARLHRIRSTAPARAALARAHDELAQIGKVPPLPADAEAQRQAAVAAREQAAHDLGRERAHALGLQASIENLVIDDALLAEGDAIDALAADRNRIAGAQKDREAQRIVAEQRRRAVQEAGRRLGQTADAQNLAASIPDALRRDAVGRAISAHDRLSVRRAKADEDFSVARTEGEAAQTRLAALPAPAASAELRAAIEAAKGEGRIDADRATAAHAVTVAQEALQAGLAALPLWTGSADALAAAPLPLEPLFAQGAAALDRAEAAHQRCIAARAVPETALAGIAADLEGFLEPGTLASEAAVAAARKQRDRAWHLIRRHRIEGGAAPSPEELQDLGPPAALPAALDTLLREADALADRRASDAERVAAYAQLRSRQAREQALLVAALADEAAAGTALAEAAAQWTALWHPSGIAPRDPATMREWLRKREELLARRDRARDAERGLAAAASRHAAAWSGLAALLPAEAGAVEGAVGTLLRAAERICRERERQETTRTEAKKTLDDAQARTEKRRLELARADADLAAWQAEWTAATAGLALPPETPPEAAKLALEVWNEVDREARAWQAARNRIEEMTLAIDTDAAATAELAGRVAPDLAGAETHAAARGLAARLATARADAARHRELTAEHEALRATIATLQRRVEAAEGTLAGLRSLAGASDDAALQAAIGRAATHAALTRQIRDREAELQTLDDGKARAELDAEAACVELDALPGRTAAIDQRLREISEQNAADAGSLAELRVALLGMEQGRDAAGAAQAMHAALADIDDIAARYVRLRLAQTLLRAAIEQFRREQQGPLLGHAGKLFSRLTEGRYDRLDVDDADDGTPVIVALRPDGTFCPAERLSDGTRDQLYLALRLAAIAGDARAGEPLPFIADDLLVNFDDRRARAALRALAEFGAHTQTILFTHHARIAELAAPDLASLHHLLPGGVQVAA